MKPLAAIAIALVAISSFSLKRAAAQMRVEVEAARGEPFGVGRLTLSSGGDFRVNIPPLGDPIRRGGRIADLARRVADKAGKPTQTTSLDATEMSIVERSGRVFYPVFEKRERPILSEFVSVPKQTTVFFLFEGDAPLDLTVYTPAPQAGQVVPRRDPQMHDRLLRAWWSDFSAAADSRNSSTDFPPLVEEYLVDTLARRLRLPLPERAATRDSSIFQSELNLLAGTEQARQEAARAILTRSGAPQPATEPLPEELPRPKPEVLNPAEAQVEPIALHVPVECFYVRFGSFANFQWLRHRMEEWGGELRDVISERGLDYGLNERMQRQLGLREGKLAELLGESVIADVAMIGTDTFFSEGAAIGIMFRAKNNTALAADLLQQRATALRESKGGKQQNVTISGKSVSYISTPEGSLRSFYVSDGEFHLVTTSRTLVEWFLAVGAGKHDSLGASEEFHLARKYMPLERGDTVFAYFSPAFFQNLLSAHYQIELERRLRSSVEIDLLRIARLDARGEGNPAQSIEELVAAGYLPSGFGQRADGSQLVVDGEAISDSIRGGDGSFVPIPDVPLDKVTADELRDYVRLSDEYTTAWGPMDPIVAGIKREALPQGGLERITLDLKAAPLSKRHAQMLSDWLGPPTDQRLAPIEGDVVSIEAVMRGGSLLAANDHHLFGALRNADPAIALDPRSGLIGQLVTAQLEGLQGYLGAWPNPGLLQLLGGIIETPVDASGLSRSLAGVWKRQVGDFTLLSFHPEILDRITPQLKFEKAPRPAQAWLRAADLTNSTLAPLINAYGYRQTRQIVLGNTRYMNMLVEQLHVPPADALAAAELITGARLLEPLGGKYELREQQGGQRLWTSTSLGGPANAKQPPADYRFPALNWIRGAQLELLVDDGLLSIHGEAIMPAETKAASVLPGLPFGLSKPTAAADKSKEKAVPPPANKSSSARPPAPKSAAPKAPPPAAPPKPTGKRSF